MRMEFDKSTCSWLSTNNDSHHTMNSLPEDFPETRFPIPPASPHSSSSGRPPVSPHLALTRQAMEHHTSIPGSVSVNPEQLRKMVEDGCKGLIEGMKMRLMQQLKSLESHVQTNDNRLTYVYNDVQAIRNKLELRDMPSVEVPLSSGPCHHAPGGVGEIDTRIDYDSQDSPRRDEDVVKLTNSMIMSIIEEDIDAHPEPDEGNGSKLHDEDANVARDRGGDTTSKQMHGNVKKEITDVHDATSVLI